MIDTSVSFLDKKQQKNKPNKKPQPYYFCVLLFLEPGHEKMLVLPLFIKLDSKKNSLVPVLPPKTQRENR